MRTSIRTRSWAANPFFEALLVEAIVWAATRAGFPIRKPVVAGAVKLLRLLDYAAVRRVLDRLGLLSVMDVAWTRFADRAEELAAEVKCPESGDAIVLEEGPGEYRCPDCRQDIVVDDDGDAEHAYLVECPIEEVTFFVGPDEDEEYECPHCEGEVWVDDGEGHHAYAEATCPETGGTVQLGGGEGEYQCPHCRGDITVDDDGGADHP